ncbi:hypothetical protein E3U55_10440 [Filobacillus milosensis]|uniref:Uncharacterized protein n=1 Tax=Filobacillus milosensis TaxID=94137 RepID=A0A4Y8IGB8_9BACI|nr:hypothetical protein [Filobacillus milosensis]TFB19571.1 hypothetical protein E3U55_10440 [Filobacillus milosensis]
MEFLLTFILLLICLGSFGEAKDVSHRVAKFGVSIIIAFYLPFALMMMMEAISFMGALYWIFYFILPSVSFFLFQIILYDIHLTEE